MTSPHSPPDDAQHLRSESASHPAEEAHPAGECLLWGVGAVSSMLGIATPTLRTWDRRYNLGPSQRTEGGHRRYSEADIARVELMSRLVDSGVPAQQAATVASATDDAALTTSAQVPPAVLTSFPSPAHVGTSTRATAGAVAALVSAAERLDHVALSRHCAQLFERRGVMAGWTDVAVPALRVIGERWAAGQLGVESEHLASERLATELRGIIAVRRGRRTTSGPVLLASAPEEQHALPLLALEAALSERRVSCLTLGARTPAGALTAAVARSAPRVVFLWASMPRPGDESVLQAWPQVGPRLIVLGGPGWDDVVVQGPPDVRAVRVNDLSSALAVVEAAA